MNAPLIQHTWWRWETLSGRMILVTNNGRLVLAGAHHAPLVTRDAHTDEIRNLYSSDDTARIIASAPDVRRHAQALIHGIDIGEVVFDSSPNPGLDEVLRQLRVALTNSGAS